MRVSVDPGKKVAGVAVYEDGELSSAWLARGASWRLTAIAVWRGFWQRYPVGYYPAELILEVPQIYHQSKLKGDPNDLVSLALMAGALAGMSDDEIEIVTYLPRQWKGQVPKSIMVRRIQEKLSKAEHSRVELPTAQGLQHNVWDAVGLGAYHERIRRGRQGADIDDRAARARGKGGRKPRR